MIANPLETLLLPFETGALAWPGGKVLFINGEPHPALPRGTLVQQYFKPKAQEDGIATLDGLAQEDFGTVLVLGSKNHAETLYFLGRALELLKKDGMLVCAAANDAGGKRLKNDLKAAGLAPEAQAKHKSQVVWTRGGGIKVPSWVEGGALQKVLEGEYVSRPGIFGWNRIDSGSALLARYLPDDVLKGTGADFGCGYGYLAAYILAQQAKVDALYCLDADYRAIEACEANLKKYKNGALQYFLWSDLTQKQGLPPLDFIVMNPPFHEGKSTQATIGTDFIRVAAASLKKGGALWMVANAHLPYETALAENFASVEKLTEEQGFKVYHARK